MKKMLVVLSARFLMTAALSSDVFFAAGFTVYIHVCK